MKPNIAGRRVRRSTATQRPEAAATLGRLGGRARTSAKSAASAANGALGGRPPAKPDAAGMVKVQVPLPAVLVARVRELAHGAGVAPREWIRRALERASEK